MVDLVAWRFRVTHLPNCRGYTLGTYVEPENIGLASDSPVATVGPAIAKHFVRAQFRHFPYAEYDDALQWLKAPAV